MQEFLCPSSGSSSSIFFLFTLAKDLSSYLFLSHSLHLWSARFGCCSLATGLCRTRGSCILPVVPICHMSLKYTDRPAGSDQGTSSAAASGSGWTGLRVLVVLLVGRCEGFYGTDCESEKHGTLLRAQTPPEARGCCFQSRGELG